MVVKAQPVMGPDGRRPGHQRARGLTVTKLAERAQRLLPTSPPPWPRPSTTTPRARAGAGGRAVDRRAGRNRRGLALRLECGEAVRAVLRTGTPQLRPHLIVAPLVACGPTLATLSLIRDPRAAPYDAYDLEVAVEFARRGGLGGQRATVLGPPIPPGRCRRACCRPARRSPVSRWPRASARGAPATSAATSTTSSRSATAAGRSRRRRLRQAPTRRRSPRWSATRSAPCAMQCSYPSHILSLLNDALLRQRTARTSARSRSGASTPPRGRLLALASGGHPLPLLLSADGEVKPTAGPGSLLGALVSPTCATRRSSSDPGDSVIFYTRRHLGGRPAAHPRAGGAGSALGRVPRPRAGRARRAHRARGGGGHRRRAARRHRHPCRARPAGRDRGRESGGG